MKSPLRYPGGKAKLVDYFELVIKNNCLENLTYLEPYAGGAGLALALLGRGLVDRISLNDADPIIYAFWRSVLDTPSELCELIESAELELGTWREQKYIVENPDQFSLLEQGFAAFFLNRTNRSGIIKGAGVIGGYEQKGQWKIGARYYRETMINRIEAISKKKSYIKFFNKDAIEFCMGHVRKRNNLTYLDPPYYEKGHRLYRNYYNPEDHSEIAKMVQNKLNGHWIVSYDNAPEIMALYNQSRSFNYGLPYTSTTRREGTESIFFSDNLEIPNICSPMVSVA